MSDIETIAASLSPPEQRAVALAGLMIGMHGRGGGEGLFSGVRRYEALVGRLTLAAERSRDVRSFWDLTARLMGWTIGPMKHDEAVLDLLRTSGSDADVLAALAERTASVVMIARQIVRRARDRDVAAARAIRDYAAAPLDALAPDPDGDALPELW